MSDIEIDLLNNIIDSTGDELNVFAKYYEHNGGSDYLFNTLCSFIDGELIDNGTLLFIIQYINNENPNVVELMYEWSSYYCEVNGNFYNLLIRLLKTGKVELNTELVNKLTKKLWKLKIFRQSIKYAQKYECGIDYMYNGIFCSLFNKNVWNDNSENLVTCIEPLLNDDTIHENLIEYIHNIIHVNLPYTSENPGMITNKKCSFVDFNKFIFKIIVKLVSYYGLNEIIQNLHDNDCEILYDISKVNSKFSKLYSTLLYSIPIVHISSIKTYHKLENEINYLTNNKTKYIFLHGPNKYNNDLVNIQFKIDRVSKIIFDSDIIIIQNAYISYGKLYNKIKNVELFNDFVTYVDYATSFINNEYGKLNTEIYKVLSDVMGGMSKNNNVRYYASQTIQKLISSEGFLVFGDIFNNLFKFISEVDFFKITQLPDAIIHHKKLVQTLIMLLDFSVKLVEESRAVVAGALFTILGRSIELFDKLTELCNSVKHDILALVNLQQVCNSMVEIIIVTLSFHDDIYDKKIITTSYPEVEDKYATLLGQLISSSTNHNHELFTVMRRPDIASELIRLSYKSLSNHIKGNISGNDKLYKIKDIITDNINISNLSLEQQNIIIEKMNSYKEIEYPPEFLDPLLCTPINDPVKIPNINDFFDRSSILAHIYNTQQNPYTRELLTVEILNEYNEKQEIKDEINEFIKKKKLFDETYNNKSE